MQCKQIGGCLSVDRCALLQAWRGANEELTEVLNSIQWLLQCNFHYHAFKAGKSKKLILSHRGYKQLVARLLEGRSVARAGVVLGTFD